MKSKEEILQLAFDFANGLSGETVSERWERDGVYMGFIAGFEQGQKEAPQPPQVTDDRVKLADNKLSIVYEKREGKIVCTANRQQDAEEIVRRWNAAQPPQVTEAELRDIITREIPEGGTKYKDDWENGINAAILNRLTKPQDNG